MKSQISVYCYFDPAYGWDARAAISALEPRGCRIVQGKDPSEILLLLQVGRPAAVVSTLADDDAAESADYMMTKRRAFDRRVPIVLVGPGQPRDGLQLLYPGEDEYAPRHLPLHALADTVMELGEHPPWEAESAPPAPILKLDDPAIEPAMGAPSGEGEVLIASEAPEKASPSRGDLDMGAIPASAVFGDDTFAGKLSEAIEGEPAEPAPRSWLKIAAIIAGAAVGPAVPGPGAAGLATIGMAGIGRRPRR